LLIEPGTTMLVRSSAAVCVRSVCISFESRCGFRLQAEGHQIPSSTDLPPEGGSHRVFIHSLAPQALAQKKTRRPCGTGGLCCVCFRVSQSLRRSHRPPSSDESGWRYTSWPESSCSAQFNYKRRECQESRHAQGLYQNKTRESPGSGLRPEPARSRQPVS